MVALVRGVALGFSTAIRLGLPALTMGFSKAADQTVAISIRDTNSEAA
ncbi:hypothetical protein [Dactylosporangium darangshiense]